MRHRVLVLAQDVALRSTLARWLVAAGYLVELAENDRRARQLLANQRMALTIVVLTAGTPIFDPGEKGGKLVIVTERSQDLSPLTRSTPAAEGYLSLPLDEQEVLARVEAVLQPQAEALPAAEISRDDVPPTAQDGTAHRFGGARQPGVGMVEFVPSIRRRDPIGRPVQDHREARAATFRQEHKRVEPRAVAHRHHGLK